MAPAPAATGVLGWRSSSRESWEEEAKRSTVARLARLFQQRRCQARPPMRFRFDFAAKRAQLSPDALAFAEVESGRQLTFAEFNARAEGGANLLERLGVAADDRVAVLSQLCDLFRGALRLRQDRRRPGATQLAPDRGGTRSDPGRLRRRQAAARHGHRRARASAGGPWRRALHQLRRLQPCCRQGGLNLAPRWRLACRTHLVSALHLRHDGAAEGRDPNGWHGLGQCHQGAASHGAQQCRSYRQFPAPVPHGRHQFAHAAGVHSRWQKHGSVEVRDRPLLDLIAGNQVTVFFAVPTIYQALSQHSRFAEADLSRVRHWGCGGAPLAENLIRRFLAKAVRVCNGMGMTETGLTVFLMDPERAAAKIGSVGKPQLLSQVRLVDVDGRDVADGEQGEVLLRGSNIMPSSFNTHETAYATVLSHG